MKIILNIPEVKISEWEYVLSNNSEREFCWEDKIEINIDDLRNKEISVSSNADDSIIEGAE